MLLLMQLMTLSASFSSFSYLYFHIHFGNERLVIVPLNKTFPGLADALLLSRRFECTFLVLASPTRLELLGRGSVPHIQWPPGSCHRRTGHLRPHAPSTPRHSGWRVVACPGWWHPFTDIHPKQGECRNQVRSICLPAFPTLDFDEKPSSGLFSFPSCLSDGKNCHWQHWLSYFRLLCDNQRNYRYQFASHWLCRKVFMTRIKCIIFLAVAC